MRKVQRQSGEEEEENNKTTTTAQKRRRRRRKKHLVGIEKLSSGAAHGISAERRESRAKKEPLEEVMAAFSLFVPI
jgi:hypothetical protein